MTNEASPWSNQPAPSSSAPASGWAQPGQATAGPPPAGYGPVPGGYPGPTAHHAPAPAAYGPLPTGYPGAPGYAQPYPPVGYAVPLRTDYTGWGKRVGASMIDYLPQYIGMIVFYVGYISWFIQLSLTSSSSTPDFTTGVVPMIVGGVIWLAGFGWSIYNRWILAGRTGQSLGKRVTKTRLISETTNAPIGASNAFLRDLVHILDGMAYVGYLWPLWDDKRQTFADKLMRTIVVNDPS